MFCEYDRTQMLAYPVIPILGIWFTKWQPVPKIVHFKNRFAGHRPRSAEQILINKVSFT